MSTHLSERDKHDKILTSHTFPNNVKKTQKLDEYIIEFKSENKK